MFTGIIKSTAKIISISEKLNFRTHTIQLPNYMLDNLEIGASVAHNGCCLTVTKIHDCYVSFDLIKETLSITNLGELMINDIINVERALKANDEIGGHLMSGHIITTAKLVKITSLVNNFQIWFKLKNLSLMKYISYKGFIGIDGISLTVGEVTNTQFCVNLIPETLKRTTLGLKKLEQNVNIEIDSQTQNTVDAVERILLRNKCLN